MKDLNKLFKWLMWLLFIISVGIIVWGMAKGYPTSPAEPDGGTVNVLLYWCYAMIGICALCAVVFGVAISIANNPKSLMTMGIGLVAAVAVCGIAYAIAPGNEAIGLLEQPTSGTLKFTDTMLYIMTFAGVLAVIAIIFGEILSTVRNK